eukprot:scaffold171509_cov33-Tisochrysis_lutea.AAC.1
MKRYSERSCTHTGLLSRAPRSLVTPWAVREGAAGGAILPRRVTKYFLVLPLGIYLSMYLYSYPHPP